MSELISRAARVAQRIAALRPDSRILVLSRDLQGQPLRDGEWVLGIEWERRPNPRPESAKAASEIRAAVRSFATEGVSVAVEGVCRVTEGGSRLGQKTTNVVVHVIADDEPARVVLLPTE